MAEFDQQILNLQAKATLHPTLGMSSSDFGIQLLIKTSSDQQETGRENNAKNGHQDQKLKTTESTPPPAKQYNCDPETEAEKPGQWITPPNDQSWWLLSFVRHYSGPSNWFPVDF